MSNRDKILKSKQDNQSYDLNEEEKLEVASLIALEEQAQAARNFIYTRICQSVAARYEIHDKGISLNFEEIMRDGAKVAKLVVTD